MFMLNMYAWVILQETVGIMDGHNSRLLTTGGHSAPNGIIAIGGIFKREAKF